MKKLHVAAAGAAVLALGYPAAAWVFGQRTESALAESYQRLAETPYLKVVQRDYDRGVFSATETVTYELFPGMAAGEQPLRFTVRSDIKHGPLAGLRPAAAVIDSELVLSEEAKKGLAEIMGDKKPLTAHTVIGYSGASTATISSPAFAAKFPTATGGESSVNWEGVNVTVSADSNVKRVVITGTAPKLEIDDGAGAHVLLSGLSTDADQTRVFDDEPMLRSGTVKFAVSELSVSGVEGNQAPVVLKQVSYDAHVPVSGDYLDLIAKFGAQVVQVGDQNYGPAHYDFSLNHMHARTTAKLYRMWMEAASQVMPMAAEDPSAAGIIFASLMEPAFELLQHNPEIRLDRISFTSPHGEVRVTAAAKLDNAKPEDFADPTGLLAKIAAHAELSVPEPLLMQLSAGEMAEGADPASHQAAMEQGLSQFAEQGYITREGGIVKTKFVYANGAMTVNGKPFDPAMMSGASASMDDEGLGDEMTDEGMSADDE